VIKTRAALARMKAYVPGKMGQGVKLNQNENPLGAAPGALAAAQEALTSAYRYPDPVATALRERLAKLWALPADHFLVGNGSDELFRLLAEAYLEPGDKTVIPATSFSYYRFVTDLMGAEPIVVPLVDGTMDLSAMAVAAQSSGAKLIFLCRPNNPTGGVFPLEAFERFMAQVPAQTLVVLDEAYREFDPSEFPSEQLVRRYSNLVITRTFSKLHGLAALRLGYGVGQPAIWAPLLTIRDPFSINAVAAAAGVGALDDEAHIQASLDLVREGREVLYRLCRELGLRYYPSAANFVLIELGRPAAEVAAALEEQGVLVRPCASFGLPNAIRVTVGRPEENEAFAQALRTVLSA
jgi:histidinol-phosphate aminotransferase